MFTYRVYDFDYDDTKSFDLLHKTEFTKEEYENIVNECRKKVCSKIRRNRRIIEGGNELSDERSEELELWSCNGEWDIYENIYKILMYKK